MKQCIRLLVFGTLTAVLQVLIASTPPHAYAEGGTWPPVGELVGATPLAMAIDCHYAYVATE